MCILRSFLSFGKKILFPNQHELSSVHQTDDHFLSEVNIHVLHPGFIFHFLHPKNCFCCRRESHWHCLIVETQVGFFPSPISIAYHGAQWNRIGDGKVPPLWFQYISIVHLRGLEAVNKVDCAWSVGFVLTGDLLRCVRCVVYILEIRLTFM